MDNYWKDKKVLVTGGTGFLGKHLVDELVKREAIVSVVDFRKPSFDIEGFSFQEADIRDKEKIASSCREKEAVFHLAAVPSIARAKPDIYHQVNVEGTRNLLEGSLSSGVKKVIHVSSSTVYGVPDEFPLKETSPLHPIGKYGRSKLAAEELCSQYAQKGLNVSIIRPRVIMGPGRIGIFSILFERIMRNQAVYTIGRGNNVFQFTHVADMSSACVKAAEDPKPGLFNVGSEETLTVKEELSLLIKHAASSSRIISIPASFARFSLKSLSFLGISPLVDEQFTIADRNFKLDTAYAGERLGWHSAYSNLESLIEAFDWYRSNIAGANAKQYKSILGVLGKFKHSHMGGFQN